MPCSLYTVATRGAATWTLLCGPDPTREAIRLGSVNGAGSVGFMPSASMPQFVMGNAQGSNLAIATQLWGKKYRNLVKEAWWGWTNNTSEIFFVSQSYGM